MKIRPPRVIKFIVQHAKPGRMYLAALPIIIFLIALDNTGNRLVIKNLIDAISGQSSHNLWHLCLLYGVLHFALMALWTFSDYCVVRYSLKFRLDVVETFMERLYTYPYTFFQNQLSGALASKLNDLSSFIILIIHFIIFQLGYFILLVAVSLVFLWQISSMFAGVMVVWVLFFVTISVLTMKKAMRLNSEYAEEKSKVMGVAVDYLSNMLSVKAFSNKVFEMSRFHKASSGFLKTGEQQGFFLCKFYSFQGFFTGIYSVALLAVIIFEYQSGHLSPGACTFVIMTSFHIVDNLFNLSHQSRDFVTNWGAVDQAIEILENTQQVSDNPDAYPLCIQEGKIVFDKVNFHYENTEPLFKNTSITIEGGQKVGFVGYSGGGKTTFVNLLLRLFDLDSGCISIDGQNIQDVMQDSLRKAIALIPQDPVLFHRSIMENIRYGRVDSIDQEVIEAARYADAHDFISKLPYGYNSVVGERGVKLSGGQRQRIAIARAFLKNASIIILDEASSQLDSLTEQSIQKSLKTLTCNKTTLVIAHRLSTLMMMDRILVFDHGKIVEDGSHSELLSKNGLYKKLWDAQVGGFLGDGFN